MIIFRALDMIIFRALELYSAKLFIVSLFVSLYLSKNY